MKRTLKDNAHLIVALAFFLACLGWTSAVGDAQASDAFVPVPLCWNCGWIGCFESGVLAMTYCDSYENDSGTGRFCYLGGDICAPPA